MATVAATTESSYLPSCSSTFHSATSITRSSSLLTDSTSSIQCGDLSSKPSWNSMMLKSTIGNSELSESNAENKLGTNSSQMSFNHTYDSHITCKSNLISDLKSPCTKESINTSFPKLVFFSSNITPTKGQLVVNGDTSNNKNYGLNNLNNVLVEHDPRAVQLALELSMVGLNDTVAEGLNASCKHIQQYSGLEQESKSSVNSYHNNIGLNINSLNTNSSSSVALVTNNPNFPRNVCETNIANTNILNQIGNNTDISCLAGSLEERTKKSQNMTECVPVPSSEHVAEIVGRQGCKIKALRTKTNTYIKTPVRGEEPVFVVTGRKEDVTKAKLEIISAAEHFSLIRASRKLSIENNFNRNNIHEKSGSPQTDSTHTEQVTIQVRVPYRVVGLVVGPKGATIKNIQQETQTYIVTPSRENEPIFDVTGLPENVQLARKQIEAHIALRTGNLTGTLLTSKHMVSEEVPTLKNETMLPYIENNFNKILNDNISPDFLATLYQKGIYSAIDYVEKRVFSEIYNTDDQCNQQPLQKIKNIKCHTTIKDKSDSMLIIPRSEINNFQLQSSTNLTRDKGNLITLGKNGSDSTRNEMYCISDGHTKSNNYKSNNSSEKNFICKGRTKNVESNIDINMARSCSSPSSTTSSKSTNYGGDCFLSCDKVPNPNIWKNLKDSLDLDENLNEWSATQFLAALTSTNSSSTSTSPIDSLLGEDTFGSIFSVKNKEIQNMSPETIILTEVDKNAICEQQSLQQNIVKIQEQNILNLQRNCLLCSENEVTEGLVPCGHNMFCLECVNRISLNGEGTCPICGGVVYHAIRILA